MGGGDTVEVFPTVSHVVSACFPSVFPPFPVLGFAINFYLYPKKKKSDKNLFQRYLRSMNIQICLTASTSG